jgi:hypothetical protein
MQNNRIISSAISAISAGLGAMLFRNKLHRLQESFSETAKQRLKTGAKVGAGLAAAGAVGVGLYKAAKGEDGKLSVDNLKDTGRRLVGGVKNLVSKEKEEIPNNTPVSIPKEELELKSSHTTPNNSEPIKIKPSSTTKEELELKSSHTTPDNSELTKTKSSSTTKEEPIPHKTGIQKSNYYKNTLRDEKLSDEVSNKGILPVSWRGPRKPEGHAYLGKG